MLAKVLNAAVSGLTAIPFAFAAYHVCRNFLADPKPAAEVKDEPEQPQQVAEEQDKGSAAPQEGAESEASAPVIITSGNKVSITETNVMEELNNVPQDDE